ncbi:MAG: hypothetical protein ACK6C4_01210, partial [Bacteroidota bacterium]
MARKKAELRKVFQPSDSIAFMAIGVGLVIAVVAPGDNVSVRLIGICIAILGGVALFMMVSPRLTDLQIITPVRPSSTPDIMSRTVQDAKKRTQTFDSDEYRRTFGQAETEEQPFYDESQTSLFEESLARPQQPPEEETIVPGMELITDADSSVRIIGTRKSSSTGASVPTLVSHVRQAARQAQIDELTQRRMAAPLNDADPFAGGEADEIQLSDDVIIRPLRTPRAADPLPEPMPERADDVSPEVEAHEGDAYEPPAETVADEGAEQAAPEIDQELIDSQEEAAAWEAISAEIEVEASEPEPDVPAPVRETSRRSPTVSLSTFVNEQTDEDLTSQEPRREFDYLLNRVLMV